MYCGNCGMQLVPGQPLCPQCGRPVPLPAPPIPGMEFAVESYRGKIRALSIVWFVYAAVTLALGVAGISFARAFFFNSQFGPFVNHPVPPMIMPLFHLMWIAIVLRAVFAAAVGWVLMEHTGWGRTVAIILAFLALLHFPLGTALGIWTLVVLLGYRNSALYEQL